jgi:hypothetical protein
MKRIMPPEITITYISASDSEKRLQLAYNRIFDIARRNIIKRRQLNEGRKIHM